jgi:hypothetical protein
MNAYCRFNFSFMVIFCALVIVLMNWLFPSMKNAFVYNFFLNSIIFFLTFFGIGWTFFVHYKLRTIIKKIEKSNSIQDFISIHSSHTMQPVRRLLDGICTRGCIDKTIELIEVRMDDWRNINHYLMGILIFLGVLGTFWGLCQTVSDIAKVISGINLLNGDVQKTFYTLKEGLHSPLSGMGTAFSSSMFGLVGSMMIGFLDLQNNRLIRRFFYYLEEKLQDWTVFIELSVANNETSNATYILNIQQKTIHQLEQVCNLLQACEDNRLSLIRSLQQFNKQLQEQGQNIIQISQFHHQLGKYQFDLHDTVNRVLSYRNNSQEKSIVSYLEQFNVTLNHLLEEAIKGREQMTDQLQKEIRLITQTIASFNEPTA